MFSIDTIKNWSNAFHWASREAALCINDSLDTESLGKGTYTSAFEARTFFVSQAVSSAVAIPFVLLSSFFVMLWEMGHCEATKALNTIPAALNASSDHLLAIFTSTLAFGATMEWTKESLAYFQTEESELTPREVMSPIDTIENLSSAFHWGSEEAVACMNKSLKENSCTSELEAKIFFAAQAVSSAVAIPLILISSFFVLLWELVHCKMTEAVCTIPAALITSGHHVFTLFASILAVVAPLEWTSKSLDSFQIGQKKH